MKWVNILSICIISIILCCNIASAVQISDITNVNQVKSPQNLNTINSKINHNPKINTTKLQEIKGTIKSFHQKNSKISSKHVIKVRSVIKTSNIKKSSLIKTINILRNDYKSNRSVNSTKQTKESLISTDRPEQNNKIIYDQESVKITPEYLNTTPIHSNITPSNNTGAGLDDANNIKDELKNKHNTTVDVSIVTMDDILTGKRDLYEGDIIQLSRNGIFLYVIYKKMVDDLVILYAGGLLQECMEYSTFLDMYTGIKLTSNDLTSKYTILDQIGEIQTSSSLKHAAYLNRLALAREILVDVGVGLSTEGMVLLTAAFIALMAPEPIMSKGTATVLAATGLVLIVVGDVCSFVGGKVLNWFK